MLIMIAKISSVTTSNVSFQWNHAYSDNKQNQSEVENIDFKKEPNKV